MCTLCSAIAPIAPECVLGSDIAPVPLDLRIGDGVGPGSGGAGYTATVFLDDPAPAQAPSGGGAYGPAAVSGPPSGADFASMSNTGGGQTAAAPGSAGTLDEMADYLTDGYWNDSNFSGFAFADGNITVNLSGLTGAGQQLARWALDAWEMVADLNFTEVGGNAEIMFDDNQAGAFAGPDAVGGNGVNTSSTVNVSTNWLNIYGTGIDSYSFSTYLHEIGHALGLGHQGDYDGNASYGRDATFANDSWQLSIMSYFDQSQNPNVDADYGALLTPMMVDIIAIQNLYGAPDSGSATAGDTTWGANTTLGGYLGAGFDSLTGPAQPGLLTEGEDVAFTIYDRDGIDTMDLSFSNTAADVSMEGGTFSDVGGQTGNVGIARGTVIENLTAGGGNDTIDGNGADNTILGNGGRDNILGRDGRDSLRGGSGNDTISGGSGNDSIYGDADRDTLSGGEGNDSLWGGNGGDRIETNQGDDYASGGSGDDKLLGVSGDDTLLGGSGNDTLDGGGDDDVIDGANGNDRMRGGRGDDEMTGGNGNDTINVGADNDSVLGGDGNDRLLGGKGRDSMRGGSGDDEINAGSDDDMVWGDDGHDRLLGAKGDDTVQGGGGDDDLFGNAGDDILRGGGGDDSLTGGDGDDSLDGGAGNDTLVGSSGADVFIFDEGSDLAKNFSLGQGDTLSLDDALWDNAGLSARDVVDTYGRVSGNSIWLEFDGGHDIQIQGVNDLGDLAGALDIF